MNKKKSKLKEFENHKNFTYFDKEDYQFSNLNIGLIEDYDEDLQQKKLVWYYGKVIELNKSQLIEGIILSERLHIINETSFKGRNNIEDFGIRYTHKLEMTDNFWSNKSIKSFLKKDKDFKRFKACKKTYLFNLIRKKILYYMDLVDEREADLCSIFCILTYCYELFESVSYLYFYGLRESGKSKLKKIIKYMSFNADESVSISESSFFRTIENTKGLLCIDEYENDKKKDDRMKYTNTLIRAGNEKGAGVKRMDHIKYGLHINRKFDTFCPKIVCNISGLDLTTKSRFITLTLHKTLSKKGQRKPKFRDPEWQEIRDFCYTFVMIHFKEILATYESYTYENLLNRDEDNWKPILSIAKFLDKNIHNRLLDYCNKSIEDSKIDVSSNDRNFTLLMALKNNVKKKGYYKAKIIKIWFNDKIDDEKTFSEWTIGKLLSRMIFEKRRNPDTEYYLSPELIKKQINKLGFELEESVEKTEKEEKIETETTETLNDKIIIFIKEKDTGKGVLFNHLHNDLSKQNYSAKEIIEAVNKLTNEGIVYEIKNRLKLI